MKKDKAIDVFLAYLEEEVLAKSSDVDYWLGAFSLCLFKPAIVKKLESYEPFLKMAGALSEEGDIDLDRLNEALGYAFSKKPQFSVDFQQYIPYLNFSSNFTKDFDYKEIMKRLREADK